MLDRSAYLRPIAHRGFHDASQGRIENSAAAFEAAIAGQFGIECDLRPAADGTAMVFHDATLDRLTKTTGALAARTAAELGRIRYPGTGYGILTFAEMLDLVDGRVPIFAEIKSRWTAPESEFLADVAAHGRAYRGPLAIMSFDPDAMAAVRGLAPGIPRGIIAGRTIWPPWPAGAVSQNRARRLADLLDLDAAAPDFYAYYVSDLPTPATQHAREARGQAMLAWTVRTKTQWQRARAWADAPIFEGLDPRAMPQPD